MEKAPEAFRTISEVADDLDIPQHVLRFWETRFPQIKPMKRGGGRRYYRPDDVALLRGIRHLLYGQGYTIRGVQRILREQGIRIVQTVWEEGAEQPVPSAEDAAPADLAADEAEEEAGTARATVDRSRLPALSAGRRPSVSPSERKEPTFAPPSDTGPSPSLARPRGALTQADRLALQAALGELADCRRLLDTAMDEPA